MTTRALSALSGQCFIVYKIVQEFSKPVYFLGSQVNFSFINKFM